MSRGATAAAVLALAAGTTVPVPSPPDPPPLTPPSETRRTTLVPVYDPRCGPVPTVQSYREVSVEDAAKGPDCKR